ncbi:hypothetical protein NKDENANG_03515 [Candidatus Entotheonellaceae bacterium PAL068K]
MGWRLLLSCCLLLWWCVPTSADSPPCQDGLVRFLTQMYLKRSYCTCATTHREMVTEAKHIRRDFQFTLPGLSLRQPGLLPDLSQIQVRVWGTILSGPDHPYTLSVRLHEVGRKATVMVRRLTHIQKGQEFEITAGPQHRLLLRTRTPYRVVAEGWNAQLHPQQQIVLQGRACVYLVSGS